MTESDYSGEQWLSPDDEWSTEEEEQSALCQYVAQKCRARQLTSLQARRLCADIQMPDGKVNLDQAYDDPAQRDLVVEYVDWCASKLRSAMGSKRRGRYVRVGRQRLVSMLTNPRNLEWFERER